ncbi:MAG TPA: hypothetical protein VKY80_07630 [Croceibacterium sp.]|nr:hypothetical protein [Croceibacterium sp.]
MIEVLKNTPREVKGTNANGNYHFYEQIAVLRSVDRDGVEEVTKFKVTTNPGEAYEPAADYAIDPSGAYVTRDERGRDVVRLRKNIRLIRVGVARPALSKAA